MERNVFIIGCRGLPAKYGGYETFVEHLTLGRKSESIKYHVACRTNDKAKKDQRFKYNNADCFNVYVPNIGPMQAIYYDMRAIAKSVEYAKERHIQNPIFYILGCSIGPLIIYAKRLIRTVDGTVYINPDGHEWMRTKWNYFVRKYLKYSEKIMVKESDLVICDSCSIEQYIQKSYGKYSPKTTFIAYGADVKKSSLDDNNELIKGWFNKFGIVPEQYYLIVGRFVPENNYETMINEFMSSETDKKLVIITNVEGNKFYDELMKKTHFDSDDRIKFVGTVYDEDLLKKIREDTYGYIHGHSVGGTNPSLLEALASTKLNLLYDIGFNREVADHGALYWSKSKNSLSDLINKADKFSDERIRELNDLSTNQIIKRYSWDQIIDQYESRFGDIA